MTDEDLAVLRQLLESGRLRAYEERALSRAIAALVAEEVIE